MRMNKRERKIRLTKTDKESLQSAKELISKNLSKRMTITDMAAQAGMNRSKLTAAFKNFYGKSIYHFILDVRMQNAKQLLLEDDLPIKTIAKLCGYSNIQSFSKVFKKYWGEAPAQFQKNIKNKEHD